MLRSSGVKRRIHFFGIILFLCFLAGAHAAFAEQSEQEVIRKAMQEDPKLKREVYGTILMKLAFQLRRIQQGCKDDIYLFCKDKEEIQQPGCILRNRERVSGQCEKLLTEEFGSVPTKESFTHLGFTFPPGSKVYRRAADGAVMGVVANAPVLFQGVEFKAGQFSFNGGIIRPTQFEKPVTIDGVVYQPPAISLTLDGHIKAGVPMHDTEYDGIMFKGGEPVEFHVASGQIASGVILNETIIDGKKYPALTHITFQWNFQKTKKPLTVLGSTPYEEYDKWMKRK